MWCDFWGWSCAGRELDFDELRISFEMLSFPWKGTWGFWQILSEPKPAKCHCDMSISVKLLSSGVATAYTDACGHSFPGQDLAPPLTGLHEVPFGP